MGETSNIPIHPPISDRLAAYREKNPVRPKKEKVTKRKREAEMIIDAEKQEWRPIARYPDYEVSDYGYVRRTTDFIGATGYLLYPKGYVLRDGQTNGYPHVTLVNSGVKKQITVSNLVCEAFHGPKPSPKHEVAHNDGNSMNNRADNLRWDTRIGNHADKILHGTSLRGSRSPNAKINEYKAHGIKLDLAKGTLTHEKIAMKYGISKSIVTRIAVGKGWVNVHSPELDTSTLRRLGRPSKLTEEIIPEIRRRLTSGESQTVIAYDFGVGIATISRIALGKSGKWSKLEGEVEVWVLKK
jgi:hypothetical protein